jgi:hypothetical protein
MFWQAKDILLQESLTTGEKNFDDRRGGGREKDKHDESEDGTGRKEDGAGPGREATASGTASEHSCCSRGC